MTLVRVLWIFLVFLLWAASASAQTVTITEETYGTVRKITWEWTSDGSGDASGTTTSAFSGKILALVTDPDGTSAPTDNYDITITDEEGVDVLVAAGADRDTANTEQVVDQATLGVVANDTLTLTVANAGDSNAGKVFLFIR